jgi:hypothetical protein
MIRNVVVLGGGGAGLLGALAVKTHFHSLSVRAGGEVEELRAVDLRIADQFPPLVAEGALHAAIHGETMRARGLRFSDAEERGQGEPGGVMVKSAG